MKESTLNRKIELARQRLDELQRQAAKEPAPLAQGVLKALKRLQVALEDLGQPGPKRESRQRSDHEFDLIADNVPAMISYIDSDQCYRFVNKQYEILFGLPRREIIGKHVREILGEEAYAVVRSHFNQALSGRQVSYEAAIPYQYGGRRWMIASVVPDFDEPGEVRGFFHLLTDITGRKQAEAALEESQERYKGLVESSPNAIFVQQDDKLVYMNPAGLRLLGYTSLAELGDRQLKELFVEGKNPIGAAVERQQPISPDFPLVGKWLRQDGKAIDVEITLAQIMYRGKPATQGIAHDVTATNELRQKSERVERLAALGELATTIAHEIRNPLGAINLNIQFLANQHIIPQEYEYVLNDLRLGVERIEKTIEGILDFARPSVPLLEPANIDNVLDRSIRAMSNEFQKAGITIRKQCEADRPMAFIDTNQIIEVFVNLFLNAKEAMPNGGQLIIHTATVEEATMVQIEDTGQGIPPEHLERIFNPFFTTRASGTGLGLALVARILEQHKAEIAVESRVGQGTKFTITFPAARKVLEADEPLGLRAAISYGNLDLY